MKNILFTGGSGFVGKNVIPRLSENKSLNIYAPRRAELDLRDDDAVEKFVIDRKIDVIIHSANPNGVKNPACDSTENIAEDALRVFNAVYRTRDLVEKVIYFGSGAEYDKSKDIPFLAEDSIGVSTPRDPYGFSKLVMNELARRSENVYNLRLFGCYGPFDHYTKFITHIIHCILKNEKVSFRRNCMFDFVQVFDLVPILERFIFASPLYHDYNITTGKRTALSDIAKTVCGVMGYKGEIIIENDGFNPEYTGDNKRLVSEFPDIGFTSYEDGIKIQTEWEKENFSL